MPGWVEKAGQKYRPCNGTEGMIFDDEWCSRCWHDAKYRETYDGKDGCKILARVLMTDIDDPLYPLEWVWDSQGYPCCTAFMDKGDGSNPPSPPIPDHPDQKLLCFVKRKAPAPVAAQEAVHAR